MTDQPGLTAPQGRILADVRRDGQKTYNARARRPIERLEALGLVLVDWDVDLAVKGSGTYLRWRITVRPAP